MVTSDNTSRIDKVLQFALAVVVENEEPQRRRLGRIHLIKYVYLADLAYSLDHKGKTYTGVDWKFYHFGPWSSAILDRIEPALGQIGATLFEIQSTNYDKEFQRWSLEPDDYLTQKLERDLPSGIVRATRRAVQAYGDDTAGLLDYVYKTSPMLRARPNQLLDFSIEITTPSSRETPTPRQTLSEKDRRRIKAHNDSLAELIQNRLSEKKLTGGRRTVPMLAPRYDKEFFDGMAWLDGLAGPDIVETRAVAKIDDSIWTLPGRGEVDIP